MLLWKFSASVSKLIYKNKCCTFSIEDVGLLGVLTLNRWTDRYLYTKIMSVWRSIAQFTHVVFNYYRSIFFKDQIGQVKRKFDSNDGGLLLTGNHQHCDDEIIKNSVQWHRITRDFIVFYSDIINKLKLRWRQDYKKYKTHVFRERYCVYQSIIAWRNGIIIKTIPRKIVDPWRKIYEIQ